MDRFVIPCVKIDCIYYFWWDRYTPCSIKLFGLQMALLPLHLLLESDLPDLLVCLVEESVGGKLQGQSPIQKLFGEKVHTFDNASGENELPPQ